MARELSSDELLELELEDQKNVEDAPEETLDYNELFQISSYGADYTVDSIAKRMEKGQFVVPDFQRSFIWKITDASRFIESLLMRLPVPSIFLFKEHDSPRHIIVDGLQRLTTINRFYKERFEDKIFKLTGLKTKWNDRSYSELTEEDQLRLDDALIHVTIFKQESPQNNKSVYEVFERINTGGIKLSPQEMRNCVSYGPIVNFLRDANKIDVWRSIYGKESIRLKDQELILRFFAFLEDRPAYKRPLKGFLNDYMDQKKNMDSAEQKNKRQLFENVLTIIHDSGIQKPFRIGPAINTALFDAITYGVATNMSQNTLTQDVKSAYSSLLSDEEFEKAITRATADEESVRTRLNKAETKFKE